MRVEELIEALQKINDKSIEMLYWCEECHKYVELIDLKHFGFKVHPPDREKSPTYEYLNPLGNFRS